MRPSFLFAVIALVLAACKGRLSQEEFMAAYDAGDQAYVHGTIEDAERSQLAFLELSRRAEREGSVFVNARKTVWLSNVRLYDIYNTKGEQEVANRYLKDSYEYRDPTDAEITYSAYVGRVREFIDALEGSTKREWKTSNKRVDPTSVPAPRNSGGPSKE